MLIAKKIRVTLFDQKIDKERSFNVLVKNKDDFNQLDEHDIFDRVEWFFSFALYKDDVKREDRTFFKCLSINNVDFKKHDYTIKLVTF